MYGMRPIAANSIWSKGARASVQRRQSAPGKRAKKAPCRLSAARSDQTAADTPFRAGFAATSLAGSSFALFLMTLPEL